MFAFDKIIPAAFLACVALTACNHDRDTFANNGNGNTARNTAQPGTDTVAQPNMPAPKEVAPSVPQSMQGRDSRATDPLSPMDPKKESSAMPEALQGNNHSSPSVGTTSQPDTSKPADISNPIKKSSVIMPRTPKVIWV